MRRSTLLSTVLVGLLFLPPIPTVSGQASTSDTSAGRLQGVVYDSTRSEPLSDARVVLWNTPHAAVTDADGRFTIEGVPAGDYSVVFFHRRLGHLGVSSGSLPVVVRADETSSIELGTPSMLTIQSVHCTAERATSSAAGGTAAGTAAGRVQDGESGVALPRASVVLTWRGEESGELKEATTTADEEGWYHFCAVPRNRVVGARARFLDRSGVHRQFTLDPDSAAVRVDFFLDELSPSDVAGSVRDADTGEPLGDVEVTLQGTQYRGITDEEGRFRFQTVPPGTYSLEVSHLAYGTRTDTVQVGTGLDVKVAVDLSMQPVELDPIEVTAEARDMEEALVMGGKVISRDAIDEVRHRSRDVGDLLRSQNVRGLVVRRQGNNVCVGFSSGQARASFSSCEQAVVFVDGARQGVPRVAMSLQAEAIDRIILYRPVEAGTLFGPGSSSGVIKIITRSANRPR